jgi:YD repeat-containing protein
MTVCLKAIFDHALPLLLRRSLCLLPMWSSGVLLVVLCMVSGNRSAASGINYSYDSLNRLTNVNYGNGSVISYTYDAAGNRLTYSGAVANDTIAPNISITSPTTASSYTNTTATINLSGTASDNTGVTFVTWQNYSGGIGVASGTNSWSITGIPLKYGVNSISVTAYDAAGNSSFADLVVTFSPGIGSAPPNQITGNSLANGIYRFTLNGQVGSNYVICASSDLKYWTPLSTNTIPQAGLLVFVDPNAGGYAQRFYRAVPLGTAITLPPQYTISVAPSSIAYIIPSNSITVNAGANLTYTAYPPYYYSVDEWLVDSSVTQAGGTNYTLYNIQGNHVVQVQFNPLPMQLSGTVSNGFFQLLLNGPQGEDYVIQVSSNLVNWTDISTNIIPPTNVIPIPVPDPGATNQPVRFYRAKSQGFGKATVPSDLSKQFAEVSDAPKRMGRSGNERHS